jgi:PAS domain S-box-containing protein
MKADVQAPAYDCFYGGSEAAAVMRSFPWEHHGLGVPADWPGALKTTVNLLLSSPLAMFLYWGPKAFCFYNDPGSALLNRAGGAKHEIGRPGEEVWSERWLLFGPQIGQVMNGLPAALQEDQLLPIQQNGHLVNTYWSFIYSPVVDENGIVSGVLVTCMEKTGQYETQRSLHESERRLRLATQTSQIGIWEWNLDTNDIRWDNQMFTIYGYQPTPDGVVPYSVWQGALSAADLEIQEEKLRRTIANKTSGRRFFAITRYSDGEKRFIEAVETVRLNGEGRVEWIVGTNIDITDRVLAEERIMENAQRLRAALDASHAGTYRWNMQTNELMWDENLLFLLGLPPDLYVQPLNEFIQWVYRDDQQAVKEAFERCLKDGSDLALEFRVVRPDGSIRWIDDRGKTCFDAAGKPLYMTGACLDITERKLWEDSLNYQKQLLETVTANTDMALFLMDDKQFCVYMNEAAEEMTGFTLDELKGKQLHYYVHHTHPDGSPFPLEECPIDQALPTKRRTKGEEVFVHKDGSFFPVAFTASPIVVNGEPIGTVIEVRETAEEKRKEQNLRESEQRFRTLAEALPQMIWMMNAEGKMEYGNGQWEAYCGIREPSEAWEYMMHPDDRERLMAKWTDLFKESAPYAHEVRLRNREGEYRWFYSEGQPVKDASGKVLKWIGSLTDIHTQKVFSEQLEKEVLQRTDELQRSRAFVNAVLNSAQNRIIALEALRDQDGNIYDFRISYVNDIVEDELGLEVSKLIGSTCTEVLPHIFSSGEFEKFVACVNTGEMIRYETNYKGSDWYYVSLAKLGDGLTLTSVNITKERTVAEQLASLNQQLDEQNRELQRSNEDLQQFAHVASHDLKEPVRKVMIFQGRLENELGPGLTEKAGLYLKKLRDASDRMSSMIEGVLAYSSLNATAVVKENVDLNQILRNVESDLEVLIDQKNGSLQIRDLPVVSGSPLLLHQLFYNLVANALKFSRPDVPPVVTVQGERQGGFFEIVVRDNGIGFEQGFADHIFQTFSRLNAKDKYEGTGLGLSLCKKIAERHGGSIAAQGVPGEGATFILHLPA